MPAWSTERNSLTTRTTSTSAATPTTHHRPSHRTCAHLHGGVPRAEVQAKKDLFNEHGFILDGVFVDREADYLDFAPGVDKSSLATLVADHPGVHKREAELRSAVDA